jgi:hypothetical protein
LIVLLEGIRWRRNAVLPRTRAPSVVHDIQTQAGISLLGSVVTSV